ncbi:hypothetical protein CBR_g22877 [Chara braunii]|uniref:Uncharacterized protein n=1 Tax=Chara braunii TaxID=69332 RepID=A0A388L2X0_CHABU|nr:hypothetical protein CBR_g22877 [Chara braunii]|eukprot:GBG76660.1 hypothetical protein CBR_g22877 [Chara braunii]
MPVEDITKTATDQEDGDSSATMETEDGESSATMEIGSKGMEERMEEEEQEGEEDDEQEGEGNYKGLDEGDGQEEGEQVAHQDPSTDSQAPLDSEATTGEGLGQETEARQQQNPLTELARQERSKTGLETILREGECYVCPITIGGK